MEEIKVNLENLTEEERKILMNLVKKGNEEKLEIKYPKDGIRYCYINDNNIENDIFYGHCEDIYRYEHGNFFLTYEDAEFEQEKQNVLFELKYWSGLYKPTYGAKNYCLYYKLNEGIGVSFEMLSINLNNIYFESKEDVENAIKRVGEDRIEKYLFGIED